MAHQQAKMTKDLQTKLSKTMSFLLRHSGIVKRADGYIDVDEFLAHREMKRYNPDVSQLQYVVANCPKQRFLLKPEAGKLLIRANQGHTIEVVENDKLLTPLTDPGKIAACIHGTYRKAWEIIQHKGLNRMMRRHIHFTTHDFGSKEIISGMRHNVEILIHIDVKKAMEAGIKFYLSSNDVALTEGDDGVLSPNFFSKVEQVKKSGKKTIITDLNFVYPPPVTTNSTSTDEKKDEKQKVKVKKEGEPKRKRKKNKQKKKDETKEEDTKKEDTKEEDTKEEETNEEEDPQKKLKKLRKKLKAIEELEKKPKLQSAEQAKVDKKSKIELQIKKLEATSQS